MIVESENLKTILQISNFVIKVLKLFMKHHCNNIIRTVFAGGPEITRFVYKYLNSIRHKNGGDFTAFRWTFTPARWAVFSRRRPYYSKSFVRISKANFD